MLFDSVHVVAYLEHSSLELFGDEIDTSEIAIFPEKSIHKLSIANEEKLKETIITFLAKTSLKKQKVVVVLGEGVLYEKVLKFTTKAQVKKEAEEFFDSVPFPKEHIAKTTLTNDKDVYCIATNRQLYKIIAEAFLAIGWKMESVVPITLFGFPDKKLSRERAKQILKNKELLKLGNFLLENPIDFDSIEKLPLIQKEEEVKETEKEVSNEQNVSKLSKGEERDEREGKKIIAESAFGASELVSRGEKSKKKYLFLPVITIIVAAGFYALLHFHIVYIPMLQKDTIPTVVVPSKITQTPSPSPTPLKKEDLKLQVQNGTGAPGQAKKVKDALTALGYTTVDTANADSTDHTDTTVSFGKCVSKDDRDAITTALKKTFKNVVTNDSTPGSYDVVVVTGNSS